MIQPLTITMVAVSPTSRMTVIASMFMRCVVGHQP